MVAEEQETVDASLLDQEPQATYDVALFNRGETTHNTIVLGGVDVLIPIELDVDSDPFQDDAVCLESISGAWSDVRLCTDPEVLVSRDKRHLYFPFFDVPSGVYRVEIRIGEVWTPVMSGLIVSQGEAKLDGQTLSEQPPDRSAAKDDPHASVMGMQQPAASEDDTCSC
jgi:hypothetical protein